MADARKNFAYSTVATAPSPASSGTSLVVAASDGAKFPTAPFNATIWPVGAQPTTANAEIVRVTAVATDTLTITRAQESSSARTVVVGDQIAETVTAGSADSMLPFYITSQDLSVNDGAQVCADQFYEVGSGFVTELLGSTSQLVVSNDEVAQGRFAGPVPWIDVTVFGAKRDGVTDDTAAILNAIDSAPPSGAVIYFPAGVYVVNGTLDLTDREYLRLVGQGSTGSPYSSALTSGTIVKRVSGTGLLLKWEAATSPESLKGCGIQGITFHGNNLASTVVSLKSIYGGEFRDIHIHDGTTVGLALNTVNLAGTEDLQGCIFEKISIACATTAAAKGITMGSWGTGGGNTSVNVFINTQVYTQNGTGVEMSDADTNRFLGLAINRSGTAIALDMLGSGTGGSGHCRHNVFLHVDTNGASINSRGTGDGYTQPATNNLFLLSRGNGTPTPTIGTGSVVSWIDTTGLATLAGATIAAISTPALTLTGGVTGITAAGAYSAYGIDLNGGTYTNAAIRLPNNTGLAGRKADNSADVGFMTFNTLNEVQFFANSRWSGDLTIGSGFNFNFSTAATGTKIGTATNQKIGFWNATTVVQPLTTDDIDQALINTGLKASGGKTPYVNTYVTGMDETINTDRMLSFDEFYEIGSGFATELAGTTTAVLNLGQSINDLYLGDIFTNTYATSAPQTVGPNRQLVISDYYEVLSDVTELAAGGYMDIESDHGTPGLVSGADASGGFVEILTTT
jgi:hypothetical protein